MIIRMDGAGRLVLPKDILAVYEERYGWDGQCLEMFLDNDRLLLTPILGSRCIFCRQEVGNIVYKGKIICHKCLQELFHPRLF